MTRVPNSIASRIQKAMLKGGLAAAAPGLVALVAAFFTGQSFLQHYTGMGTMGVAAMGVILFGAAHLFFKGHWWACIPAVSIIGWATWDFTAKAARLLILYYTHNPIVSISGIIAPFSVISLQLVLVFIAFSLGIVILKALKLCRDLSPQPINRFVWGAMGLWAMVVVLDCINKFQ